MRKLLAATSLTPIFWLAAAPSAAETVISTAVTTPVLTGTAGDDLRITSTGSVKPTSGVAVTINSNDNVRNEGTIGITGANNSAGIVANSGLTANITNVGTIAIDETYTATDTDSDGDLDGTFAQGSSRYGIHVLGGGTFTGTVSSSGNIAVEGNQSAGIAIDSALAGSVTTSTGAIAVTGNDSFGLRASDVSGNVSLIGGSIAVQGGNSVGVALDGNVGGGVVLQNSVVASGYRSVTAPADSSKLDADDLLQGGGAVRVSGNVAGGILVDAPPRDNSTSDTDEDDDGIADANEATASVTAFGSAPAVAVGSSTQDITIGAVAGTGRGMVNRGKIAAAGVYKGVDSTAVLIGGSGGHLVSLTGGLSSSGAIGASANEGNATGVRVAAGGTVPTIINSGAIQVAGGGTDATSAVGIQVDAGASVSLLQNSGTLLVQLGANKGVATAVLDKSGTLNLIENTGAIGVANAAALGDTAIALDLRSNGSGATVRQLAVASGVQAPHVAGNILFGSGNDMLEVADGSVAGDVRFGAGTSELLLSGDAAVTGDIDFGGGAGTLSLAGTSVLRGQLANSGAVTATVGAGSTLDATNTGAVNLASLTTGTGATLGVTVANGVATRYVVAGSANFASDTRIALDATSLSGVAGTYTIVDAGSLSGAANLNVAPASLPFLFDADVAPGAAGQVDMTVGVKSMEELGLNASEAAVLAAVIQSADSDAPIAAAFLDVPDSGSLEAALQQMLPEHAGGAFETVTRGSRLSARMLSDPNVNLVEAGGLGLWAQQVAFGASKAIGSTSSYKVSGWGASGGIETSVGPIGSVGLSLAYLSGKEKRLANEIISSQFEGGVYWRGGKGPLRGFARGTVGRVNFDGNRLFNATVDGSAITREAEGEWKGTLYSAIGGAYYQFRSGRLSVRPLASVEYFRLKENSYEETGGGTAFNLAVAGRSSSETAANAILNLGYDLAGTVDDESWFRVELEGGWRTILSGKLGRTTARFQDGTPFTLTPEERTGGWLAGVRAIGGGGYMSVVGEITAEEQQGRATLGGRLGIQLPL